MPRPALSIVIPVFNSEDCLRALASRLQEALSPVAGAYEVLLVDDCSEDSSWIVVDELCREVDAFRGFRFRRNFGQDNAIMAGLANASGDIVVIMDDDLQHDPEDIKLLVENMDDNYDVCYGYFLTKKQTKIKNLGSWLNNLIANIVLRKPRILYLSPFKAIRRDIAKEVIKYQGPYPYVDGLILGVTSKVTQVALEHQFRYSGKGNYNIRASLRVWLRVLTSFSVAPLRLATVLGFVVSGIGFVFMAIYLVQWRLGIRGPAGWLTVTVAVLVLGGVQLMSLGLIGEYIGRIFMSQNQTMQYIVDREVGLRQIDK